MTSAIVDIHGNPIKRDTLATPQTSSLAQLNREFAAHPTRGLTPSRLASILDAAEQGDIRAQHELFLDMEEKDAHIFAEMSKRKRALLDVEWDIVPPRGASAVERKQAGYLKELLQDVPDFEDVIVDALDGIGHGFSCQEIEWELLGGAEWLPKSITHRPQSWFQTDIETRTEIRLRDMSLNGAALNPFGWITHTHRAKSGYLARSGLHRVLVWPFLFKAYSAGDMAEFLEIYGLPLRVGTYAPGASPEEKATLLRAVMSIGHDAAGIIPQGMQIDFKEAAKGAETPFAWMIAWCERSQSKAILGGTLTSQADGKSSTNALGNVHNEVRQELKVSDARQLASTLTRDLVYPLLALNKGGVADRRRLPRFKFMFEDAGDLTVLGDSLPKLVGVGMQIPVEWAHERAGIPMPEEGAAVLKVAAASPPTDSPSQPVGRMSVALSDMSLSGNAIKPLIQPTAATQTEEDQLAAATAQHWDAMIAQLKAMTDEATDLISLQQQMTASFGALPSDELVKVMAAGFALAELKGMADVSDGS